MNHQRVISKIILGLAFICMLIPLGSCLELGVNVLSEDLQIVSTDPSETFEIYVDDAQELTIILDRDVTAMWYENDVEIRSDHNTSNSSYYFTSSIEGDYNVTVFCNDSFINTSQVNYSWFISVIPAVAPYPTPPRANIPVVPYIPPVEPLEPEEVIIDEEEIEEPFAWKIPEEWYMPGILITYLDLWDESTRPWFINTAIEVLETTVWKFPDYESPDINLPDYETPEFTLPEYEVPEFQMPEYEVPEFQMPELQIPDIKLPEELRILSEIDRVIMWLAVGFLIIFIISMKGGSGKSVNPGRKEPIKI